MITLDMMRAGLANGEFYLEYLPTMQLHTGRCTGAEALIRWRRPTGVVSPGAFIPVAENTPLSGLITYWVFDQVAAELAEWLQEHRDSYISINVPPEILGRGGMEYVATKSGLIERSSQIILEVTERGVPDLLGVNALADIWGRKVLVALDDVTLVGGANIAILARCPFQIIKLDQTLISEIQESHPTPHWLPAINVLLQSSRLQIIAEGVETDFQANTLRAAGVRYAQGFHFSRPMGVKDFIAFHRAHQPIHQFSETPTSV